MLHFHVEDTNATQDGAWHELSNWVDKAPTTEGQHADEQPPSIELDLADGRNGILMPIVPRIGMECLLWDDGRAHDTDAYDPTKFTYFFGGRIVDATPNDGTSPVSLFYHLTLEGFDRKLNPRIKKIVFPITMPDSQRVMYLFQVATDYSGYGEGERPLPDVWDWVSNVDQGPGGQGFVRWADKTTYEYQSVYSILNDIKSYAGVDTSNPVKPRRYFISAGWTDPAHFPTEGVVDHTALTRYVNYYTGEETGIVVQDFLLTDLIDPTYTDMPQVMFYAGWENRVEGTSQATLVPVQGPAGSPVLATWDTAWSFAVKEYPGRLIKGNYIPSWEGSHDYKRGQVVQPKIPNGWYYQAEEDGKSANDCDPPNSEDIADCWDGEPIWTKHEGDLVEDCPDDFNLPCFNWIAHQYGNGWNSGSISTQSFDEGEWNVESIVRRKLLASDSGNRADNYYLEKLEFPDPNGKWHYDGDGGQIHDSHTTWGIHSNAFVPLGDGVGGLTYGIAYFQTNTLPDAPFPDGVVDVALQITFKTEIDDTGKPIPVYLIGRFQDNHNFWYVRPYDDRAIDSDPTHFGYALGKREAGVDTDMVKAPITGGPINGDSIIFSMIGQDYTVYLLRLPDYDDLAPPIITHSDTFLSPPDYSGHKCGFGVRRDLPGGYIQFQQAELTDFAILAGEKLGAAAFGFGYAEPFDPVTQVPNSATLDDIEFSIFRDDEGRAYVAEHRDMLPAHGLTAHGDGLDIITTVPDHVDVQDGTLLKVALRWALDDFGDPMPYINYYYARPKDWNKVYPKWQYSHGYFTGDRVQAVSGHQTSIFQANSTGFSGVTEPTWTDGEGDTISDGAISWTVVRRDDGEYRLWHTSNPFEELPLDVVCPGGRFSYDPVAQKLCYPLYIDTSIYSMNSMLDGVTLRRNKSYNEFPDREGVKKYGIVWPNDVLQSDNYDSYPKRRQAALAFLHLHAKPNETMSVQVHWPFALDGSGLPFQPGTYVGVVSKLMASADEGWTFSEPKMRLITSVQRDWTTRKIDPVSGHVIPFPLYTLQLGVPLVEFDMRPDMQEGVASDDQSPPFNFRKHTGGAESESTSFQTFRWDSPTRSNRHIEIEFTPLNNSGGATAQPRRFPADSGAALLSSLPPSTPYEARIRFVDTGGTATSDWTPPVRGTTAPVRHGYISHQVDTESRSLNMTTASGDSALRFRVPPDRTSGTRSNVSETYIDRVRASQDKPVVWTGHDFVVSGGNNTTASGDRGHKSYVVGGSPLNPDQGVGHFFIPSSAGPPTSHPTNYSQHDPQYPNPDNPTTTGPVPIVASSDVNAMHVYAYNYTSTPPAWQEISGSGGKFTTVMHLDNFTYALTYQDYTYFTHFALTFDDLVIYSQWFGTVNFDIWYQDYTHFVSGGGRVFITPSGGAGFSSNFVREYTSVDFIGPPAWVTTIPERSFITVRVNSSDIAELDLAFKFANA